jgi:hypothetical protein
MFAPAVGLVMSQIDVAGKFGAGFARDRSDFSGRNFDPERLRAVLPVVRDQAYGQLSLAEAMLADGRRFVLGAEPSMPDCALYNPVWFNRRAAHVRFPPKNLTDLLHARNRRHCATTGLMHHNGGYPMMFDPRNARQEFEKFLSGRNLNERNLNLANGCEAFFDFYHDLRPRGRVPSSVGVISLGQGRPFEQRWDADRLLFQWNIYDWGAGENFYLNLSRNLVLADDDAENEPTWQLRLTVEFEQSNDLRALGLGDKWAGPLSELPDFRAYVIPGIHNLQQASNPSDGNPSI